jgi:5-methylcytosine-specific restriction endonuclease McrA
MSSEEVTLLDWDRTRRSDSKIERLRKIRVRDEDITVARRERVPDEVKAMVWSRDEGVCVRCGADEDLQFDHVIPVARGGGNNVENIQILCGDCNRQKSDSIV